jgi:hypothetical protein
MYSTQPSILTLTANLEVRHEGYGEHEHGYDSVHEHFVLRDPPSHLRQDFPRLRNRVIRAVNRVPRVRDRVIRSRCVDDVGALPSSSSAPCSSCWRSRWPVDTDFAESAASRFNRFSSALYSRSLALIGSFTLGFCMDRASRSIRRTSASASATSESIRETRWVLESDEKEVKHRKKE